MCDGGDCGGGDCDCGDCGDCDCCVDCGDGCCLFWGDSLCCETTGATVHTDTTTISSNTGTIGVDNGTLLPTVRDNIVPASVSITDMPAMSVSPTAHCSLPTASDDGYVVYYYGDTGERRRGTLNFGHKKKKRRECCGLEVRTWFAFFLTLAIIAVLGGTLWLTLQIPFGTNCGNTHRGLMGVVLAVIVVGMCLPLYYHYIEKDLVKKEFSRQQKLASQGDLEQQQQLLQPNIFYYYDEKHKNKLKKKSVLASKRFAIALFVTGFILQIIVVLGYYYLWSDHNHCTDSRQWVVKGWFIALLIVTVAVIVCMIGVMFRSRRERKILNRMREREDDNGRHTSDMDIDTKHGMEKSMPYATTMTTMKG